MTGSGDNDTAAAVRPLSPIYDLPTDPAGTLLYKIAAQAPLPPAVKAASLAALRETAGLPHTVFADPGRRLYPCHTAASAWLSAAYFAKTAAEFEPAERAAIGRRLDDFCGYWGVARPAAAAGKTAAAGDEDLSGLPDSDFAYVWRPDGGGPAARFLPVRGPGEVKAAADYLQKHHDAMPYADRRPVASRVLDKAAAFGVDFTPERRQYLERQAGRGVCNVKRAADMVRQRALLARDPAVREKAAALAMVVEQKPGVALHPANLVKLAETVDGLDRAIGLAGRYTDAIRPPEAVLFEFTYGRVKAARDAAVPLATGRAYDRADFAKLALADVKDAMGRDFADEVATGLEVDPTKLAAVASTLPVGDAEHFETVLGAAGIRPVKAAADRPLSDAVAEKLAAAY